MTFIPGSPDVILRTMAGSQVLGVNLDTGDRDELAICIEPVTHVIGLSQFEQHVVRSKPEGVRSGPGDLDLTIYGLRKWCRLALKGNPTILMMLFTPDDACSILEEWAVTLRANYYWFASRSAGNAFLGYMQQQKQRMMGERGQRGVKRPELVDQHGYDTKYASHVLRLAYQGVEYLQTGRISVPMEEPFRERILAVRRGEVGENEVLTEAGMLEEDLKDLLDTSLLPDKPDYEAVNEFLADVYLGWWAEEWNEIE